MLNFTAKYLSCSLSQGGLPFPDLFFFFPIFHSSGEILILFKTQETLKRAELLPLKKTLLIKLNALE